MPVDDVLADFDGFMDSADHVEFYWVPHTRWALTKRNRRTDEPIAARGRAKEFIDDIVLTNGAFGLVCRLGRRWPRAIPRLAKAIPSASSNVEYTDRSDKVFTSPRLVHFYEMEYAIPREAIPEALNRVRALVDRLGVPISFPVEVRVVAPDDIPLSTAYGRATGYIAVHVYQHTPYDQYFQGVEAIMNDYAGRPHWGKMHFQTAASLAPRYPRWDAFQAVRDKLDPERRFTNPYLDRVLGWEGHSRVSHPRFRRSDTRESEGAVGGGERPRAAALCVLDREAERPAGVRRAGVPNEPTQLVRRAADVVFDVDAGELGRALPREEAAPRHASSAAGGPAARAGPRHERHRIGERDLRDSCSSDAERSNRGQRRTFHRDRFRSAVRIGEPRCDQRAEGERLIGVGRRRIRAAGSSTSEGGGSVGIGKSALSGR